MKRYLVVLAILTCAGCLWSAQTNSSQKSTQTPGTPTAAATPLVQPSATPDLPGDTVVLTIHNVCVPAATPCETKVTKDQFDELYKMFGSKNGPPAERTGLAEKYVRLLAMASGGAKDKVDETPEGQVQLQLARYQALAQLYQRKLQEDASKVSDDDVKKYYDENKNKYEEITVRRIMIPRATLPEPSPVAGAKATPTVDAQKRKQEEDEATKAIAQKAREELLKGQDPEVVEKEAYTAANSKGTPPSTAAMPRRRGAFPVAEESKIFDLKPGDISEVLDAGWGYEIYKVEGKSNIPLEKVQEEIKRTLTTQRMRDASEDVMKSANPDYNTAYFTAAPPSVGANKPTVTPTPPRNEAMAKPTPARKKH